MSVQFLPGDWESCGKGVAVGRSGVRLGKNADTIVTVDVLAGVKVGASGACVGGTVSVGWSGVEVCLGCGPSFVSVGKTGGGAEVSAGGGVADGAEVGEGVTGVNVLVLTRVGTVWPRGAPAGLAQAE